MSVVGEFNGWDGRRHPMRKRHEAGIWELFIPGVTRDALYKSAPSIHSKPSASQSILTLVALRKVGEAK